MVLSRINGQEISWQEDYDKRVNPALMTKLLHNAIPVLRSVNWRVTDVGGGSCTSELPLSYESTNQHGSHQAALISLSADYTGGLALATLLRGIPLAGVHRCQDEHSVSLWLASMEVKYRNPSTGHLVASCSVPSDVAKTVRQRYFSGKRVLVTLPVIFRSNDEIIAEARMKYFAQPSIQLHPTKENPKISPLFKHKLKASARMIAGLRATSDNKFVRIEKSHERHAAGPHGELLANRLNGILPQLRDMVMARTRHVDETISSIAGLRQVVILGVGLDMRPFRLFRTLDKPTFFELDLPEMLEERSRVIAQMRYRPVVSRRMVATDFKRDDVGDLLLNHPDYDPRVPTSVIYEGCSMYMRSEDNRSVLQAVSKAMLHPDSRLWSDWVTESVVEGSTRNEQIAAFLDGMEELGERFIFGCDEPHRFLQFGYPHTQITSARELLGSDDPTYATYNFAVSGT